MFECVARKGAEAPYPEVQATKWSTEVKEAFGVPIALRGEDAENSPTFGIFPGNRSGSKGTETVHKGDYIVKASASLFAMDARAFKKTYKAKNQTKKK